MQIKNIRRGLALGVLGLSLILLGWSLWPAPEQAIRVNLSPTTDSASGKQQLALRWPGFVRLGEPAEIRLELDGPLPTPADETNAAPGVVVLIARLDLPGLAHTPAGETSQALPPDRPVIFRWTVRADRPGDFAGTVWLYTASDAFSAEAASRRVVSAQRFALRAGGLLGLNARWAQTLGLSGSLIGAVFGLDGLALWFSRRFRIQ